MSRRRNILASVRRSIERSSYPRWQLSLILLLTGVFGFLSSLFLLWLDIEHMGWRYLAAFALAYGFFLLCLRIWARTYRSDSDLSDWIDLPSDSLASPGPEGFDGAGGTFGGGGASGSWGAESSEVIEIAGGATESAASGLSVDLDEGAVILVPIAFAAAVVLSGFVAIAFVIYWAPALLAELVLDVVILGGVYRRLRGIEPQHWVWSALRRTWMPALALGILVAGFGFALEAVAPGARTIGEALAAA